MELNITALVSRTGRHMQRYNFHGQRQVVGCIPYRFRVPVGACLLDEEDIEVLVISAQRKGKGMMFPKGGWENDESIEHAAARETVEEAGMVGDVEAKLGKWSFKSKSRESCYEGHIFPLLVTQQLESWPEKHIRQRKWVSVREAKMLCQQLWMKEALELLVHRLINSQPNDAKSQLVHLATPAGNLALIANASKKRHQI